MKGLSARQSRLLERFQDCSLPPDELDHAAHLELGWIYLERYSVLEAVSRFVADLRDYVKHHGAEGRYNETVTLAYLFLILKGREGCGSDWGVFRRRNPSLFAHGWASLTEVYAPETITSDAARRGFVVPECKTPVG